MKYCLFFLITFFLSSCNLESERVLAQRYYENLHKESIIDSFDKLSISKRGSKYYVYLNAKNVYLIDENLSDDISNISKGDYGKIKNLIHFIKEKKLLL